MTTTQIFQLKCSRKGTFGGSIINRDFHRFGFYSLLITLFNRTMRVEIGGFCSQSTFYFKPSDRQKISNELWLNKYVFCCDEGLDKDQLIAAIRAKCNYSVNFQMQTT